MVDAGVPTAKAFMVFDFRLADRAIFEAMRILGERGGMLQLHCEDPVLIDAAIDVGACSVVTRHRVTTLPRDHRRPRRSRPTGRWPSPGPPTRPSTSSTCRARRRSATWPRRKAAGVRAHAETCPHYLTLTDDRYDERDPVDLRLQRHLAAAPSRPPTATRCGPASPTATLDLVATDHVAGPSSASRRARPRRASRSTRSANGAPGIETLLTIVHGRASPTGRITVERMVDLLVDDAGPPVRPANEGRDRGRQGRRPRALRPCRAPHDPGADLHHTSDYTPYEGLKVAGAVRSVFVRGRAVVRNDAFVGDRGFGPIRRARRDRGVAPKSSRADSSMPGEQGVVTTPSRARRPGPRRSQCRERARGSRRPFRRDASECSRRWRRVARAGPGSHAGRENDRVPQ